MSTSLAARDPARLIWGVAGGSWATICLLLATAHLDLANHDQVIEGSSLPLPVRLLAFAGAWVVMVGAMMLPSTVPMVRMFVAVTQHQADPRPARAAFGAAYLVTWVGFALVALAGDTAVHWTVHHAAWLEEREPLILGATLTLAGAYQLSPLKDACLRACRTPLSMIAQHHRPGAGGGWRVGTAHALNCLGCCWALMLVMFATGVGSLLWMVGLTAVMVAEKTSPAGRRLVRPVAGVLLAAGLLAGLPALVG